MSAGSSPHTRGTHCAAIDQSTKARFIPTHTGNTTPRHSSQLIAPVHPHTHGEHQCFPSQARIRCGSSPHTRGTRNPLKDKAAATTVHPHTHGEHRATRCESLSARGSSPHTRGTLRADAVHWESLRFIPTHTGNTRCDLALSLEPPVHPHTHGEHHRCGCRLVAHAGSSPHTRGTRKDRTSLFRSWRFIPTHTGNTFASCAREIMLAVHPHTHGEHFNKPSLYHFNDGSSPHTRGTQVATQ